MAIDWELQIYFYWLDWAYFFQEPFQCILDWFSQWKTVLASRTHRNWYLPWLPSRSTDLVWSLLGSTWLLRIHTCSCRAHSLFSAAVTQLTIWESPSFSQFLAQFFEFKQKFEFLSRRLELDWPLASPAFAVSFGTFGVKRFLFLSW